MSEGLIDPSAVPIPHVKPEELRTAADALNGDGGDISQAGHDIKSSWQGLDGIYVAPESGTLFDAINPVADKGDDVDTALGTVASALHTFADEAERLKTKLEGLKADAQTFVGDVEGDDDWREDEDKVNEHNGLNNDILAALHEYQEAERTCANKITALFGGTTFVGADPGGGEVGPGEQAYGTEEALSDVKTPWATPQEYDAPWYEDAWNGVKDFGVGIAEDLGAMVGLYGENGWGVSSWGEWGTNLKNNWGDTLAGLGSLVGLYGENGWGVGSFGEWWGNFSSGWTEFAHAIVPWREWGDRPGYVITQSALNIGSMFLGGAGVVKALAKGARKVGGGDGDAADGSSHNGDGDTQPSEAQLNQLQQIGNRPGQTTQDLQNQLDDLDLNQQQLDGLQNTLDQSQSLEDQATPVGGGNDPVNVDPAFDNGQHTPQYQHSGGNGGNGFDGGNGYEGSGNPPGGGDDPGGDGGRPGGPEGDGGDGDQQGGQQDDGQQHNGDSQPDPGQPEPDGTDPDRPDSTDPDRPNDAPESGADEPSTDRPADLPENRHDGDQDTSSDPDPAGEEPPPQDRPKPRLSGSEGPAPDGDGIDDTGGSDDPNADDRPQPDPLPDPPLDETYQPPGEWDSKGFVGTNTGSTYRVGWTDDNGYYHDGQGNTYVEAPDSLDALKTYQEIRATDGDTAEISANTGIDQSVLDRVKQHLFEREHVVATDPNQHRFGLFSPAEHVGDLWQKAASGDLSPREAEQFRRLMIHEGVESALMERGIPYRSTHPDYYDGVRPNAGPNHFGAHDLAPGEHGNMWAVTDKIGIQRPGFEVNQDLSNLDQLIEHVLREIGHE